MKVRQSFLFSLAVAIACLFSAQSKAADFSFYIGGVRPGKISVDNVKKSLDSSPVFGFRVGTSFGQSIGTEHTLAFSSDYLFPRDKDTIRESKGFVYNSNLIINIPAGKVVPYLTAGAGLIHQYGDLNMPVGTEFAFNYGGGLKFPRILGPLGLRFDVRGYRVGIFSNKLNIFEASGGVLLSMGK
jgi:hypothetical protein